MTTGARGFPRKKGRRELRTDLYMGTAALVSSLLHVQANPPRPVDLHRTTFDSGSPFPSIKRQASQKREYISTGPPLKLCESLAELQKLFL